MPQNSVERDNLGRVRLLQVEGHVHLTVQRDCDGQVFTSLLTFAGALIELAKAEVAMKADKICDTK